MTSTPTSSSRSSTALRTDASRSERSLIVVGLDGSEPARAALQFAAEEATFRGASLRVVSVWRVDSIGLESSYVPLSDYVPIGELLEEAKELADDTVAHAREELGRHWPALEFETKTIEGGPPGDTLVDESKGATLLVVGNRGRGSLGSLLLGSVSEHVVRNAHCPVVVIPHGWIPSSEPPAAA